MTCNNCGAPIPAGMRVCPYCHAEVGAPSAPAFGETTGFGEETSFADPGNEYPSDAAESAYEGEETEYAGEEQSWQQPTANSYEQPAAEPARSTPFAVPPRAGKVPAQKSKRGAAKEKAKPAGKAKKAKAPKASAKEAPKKKKSGGKLAVEPKHIVLLVILAALIVLLVLKNLGIVTI